MNKLVIIGRLVKDPETRQTQNGISVTTFSVAVNRRKTQGDHPEADYFRVTAWRGLADICSKYLAKGRRVCVVGPVSISTYQANDGTTRASMEVTADDVEFLSSKNEDGGGDIYETKKAKDKEEEYLKQEREGIQNDSEKKPAYVQVDSDDLPF